MWHRRVSKLLAVVVASSLSLVACKGTDAGGGSTLINIGVGIDAAYAPFFVADQEGLFKAAGLHVKLVQFGTGGQAVSAVGTGRIQIACSSNVTTTSQAASDPKLRAFSVYESSGDYNKAVLRKGVQSPKDVKNFGVVQGISQFAAYKYLKANGVDTSRVKMVQAGTPDMIQLMQRGSIDGFVLWQPWPQKAVSQGIGSIVANSSQFGVSFNNWLISSNAWLTGHDATAQKVARVLDQAAQRIKSDPDLAAKDTEKAVAIKPADTLQQIKAIKFGVTNFTPDSVAGTKEIANYFVQIGAIKNTPDVDKLLMLNWYKGQG